MPKNLTLTEATELDAAEYARLITLIEALVAETNTTLGYSTEFDADMRRTCITFGYIGNLYYGPERDDRSWMVFLPHPGRVGTDEDHIGSFRTGDTKGARSCYADLRMFAKGARFAKIGA